MTTPDTSEIVILVLVILSILAIAWCATRRGIDEE